MIRIKVSRKTPMGMSQYNLVEPDIKMEVSKLLGEASEIRMSGPDEDGIVSVTLETYAMLPSQAQSLMAYIVNMKDRKTALELKAIINGKEM